MRWSCVFFWGEHGAGGEDLKKGIDYEGGFLQE